MIGKPHVASATPTASPSTTDLFAPTALAANPFAPLDLAPSTDVPEDAPEGSYTYAMVKSAPDVSETELESDQASIELRILWGANVLHIAHLTPPRSFWIGEEEREHLPIDFLLPAEKLGASRAPLLLVDPSGAVDLVIPARATGWIEIPGERRHSLADMVAAGRAQPCAELTGAMRVALPARASARVELGDMTFQVSQVNAARAVAGHFSIDTKAAPYHGVSALIHVGLLAAAAIFMPPLSASAGDDVSPEQQYLMGQYLAAASMRELAQDDQAAASDSDTRAEEGGTGQRSIGEEGKAGSTTSTATNKRWAIERNPLDPDPRVAKAAALQEAATFGIIPMLSGSDMRAPIAPWGALTSSGNDAVSANGNMWGAEIGDAAGNGGLGLTGIGESGGGSGLGIGLGPLGTLGHGSGLGDGQGFGNGPGGFGHSGGRMQPKHAVQTPRMRPGSVTVGGHLPPEVIQRIVRQNFGRFRFCYENALRNNPSLQGRVAVRFVIGRDGAVSCVVRAFYGLSFPQPDEGGIVTVVYPIMFTPGG